MKTKRFLITILALSAVLMANAQANLFEKLSNNKNVTTVYISKALLSMMPADMDMGGANIKGLASKLEKIEIYTSENKEAIALMKAETEFLKKNKGYEALMTVKETDNHVMFYAQQDKDKFKDLLMLVDQPNQSVIIRIIGSFTSEDIQSVMNSSNKKK